MNHDYSIVFYTENELWQRVLDIFAANENFTKKRTKGRELHHKFPRSFSKKLGEKVDNDEDNLISLTPADHFRVHYYYYMLAKKGYRQPMALAFHLMVRSPSKQISPATMEEMAVDYEELRRDAINAGTANGKHSAMLGSSCTDWMTDEEIKRWKAAISKSLTGRVKSAEE